MLWAVSCGLLRRARRWGFWHGESTANDRSA
jgi:hypothetical protein